MHTGQLMVILLAAAQLVAGDRLTERSGSGRGATRLDLCSDPASGCSCARREVVCDCKSEDSGTELKIGGEEGLALPQREQSLTIRNCSSVFLQQQEEDLSENGRHPALTSLQVTNCESVYLAPKSLAKLARLKNIELKRINKLNLTTASLQLHEWTLINLKLMNIITDRIPSDVFGENAVSLESLTINNSHVAKDCNLNVTSVDNLALNNSTIESLHINALDGLHVYVTNCTITRLATLNTNAQKYSAVSGSTQLQFEGNSVGSLNTEGVSTVTSRFTFNSNTVEQMEGSQSMNVTFRSASLVNNTLKDVKSNLLDRFYQMSNVDLRWSYRQHNPTNHNNTNGVIFVGNTIGSTGEDTPDLGQILTAANDSIQDYTVDGNIFNCDQCELIQTLVVAAQLVDSGNDSDSGSVNVSDSGSVNVSDSGSSNGSDSVSANVSDSGSEIVSESSNDSDNSSASGNDSDSDSASENDSEKTIVNGNVEGHETDGHKSVSSKDVYSELYRTSVCQWPTKSDKHDAGERITLEKFVQQRMDSNQECISKQPEPELTKSGNENGAGGTSDGKARPSFWPVVIATAVVTLLVSI